MQLVYGSEAERRPPWTVDSVWTGLTFPGHQACARVYQRQNPAQPVASENRVCVRGDTLYQWVAARETWQASRPVGPRMRMIFPRRTGDTVTYETGDPSVETISGVRVGVIPTTVLTVDSLGRPRTRLRERFSTGLNTATGGTFEVPDSSGGWRTNLRFELLEIRPRP